MARTALVLGLPCLIVLPSVAQAQADAGMQARMQLIALSRTIPNDQLDRPQVEAAVRQGADSGRLDLAGMPIEDAVMLVFMQVSEDADRDMKAMLADMEQARKRKAAQREAINTTKAQQAGLSPAVASAAVVTPPRQSRLQQTAVQATRGTPDASNEPGESQQVRMQLAMDRRSKARQALSNLMKKNSDTQKNIIQNIK